MGWQAPRVAWMRFISTLAVAALMVVATIGLSGEGPAWTRYVGGGTVLLLLLLILQQLANIPSVVEQKKLLLGAISIGNGEPDERLVRRGDEN